MSASHKKCIEIYERANNDPFYNPYNNPLYDPVYNLNVKDQLIYYKWIYYFERNYKKYDFNWNILPNDFLRIIIEQ